jgi:hypothetical protein
MDNPFIDNPFIENNPTHVLNNAEKQSRTALFWSITLLRKLTSPRIVPEVPMNLDAIMSAIVTLSTISPYLLFSMYTKGSDTGPVMMPPRRQSPSCLDAMGMIGGLPYPTVAEWATLMCLSSD